MAALRGDNNTKAVSPSSDNILSPGTLGGRVRILTEQITLAAASIADTVAIGQTLQAGAIILGITVQNAALGASTTFRIGDSNDDDRYMTDIASDSAATTTAINIAGRHYKVGTNTGDGDLLYLLAGGAATGLIIFQIYYTED